MTLKTPPIKRARNFTSKLYLKKISTPKKNIFFSSSKKFRPKKFSKKKIDQKSKMLIFEKLGFSIFGRKNSKKILDRKKIEKSQDQNCLDLVSIPF